MKHLYSFFIFFSVTSLFCQTPLEERLSCASNFIEQSGFASTNKELVDSLKKAHGCIGLVRSELRATDTSLELKKSFATLCTAVPRYGYVKASYFLEIQKVLSGMRRHIKKQPKTRQAEPALDGAVSRLLETFEHELFSPKQVQFFLAYINASAPQRNYRKILAALLAAAVGGGLWWVYSRPWGDDDDDEPGVDLSSSKDSSVRASGRPSSQSTVPNTHQSGLSPRDDEQLTPQEEFNELSRMLLGHSNPKGVLEIFTQNGIPADFQAPDGRTFLYDAVVAERPDIVALLVAHGVSAHTLVGDTRTTALHRAAVLESPQIMHLILSTSTQGVDQQDGRGNTPLMLATRELNAEMVAELARHGASFAVTDQQGLTPLLKAIELSATNQFLTTMLESGASLGPQGAAKDTPLHLAVRLDNQRITEFFMAQEVAIFASNPAGEITLHEAVRANNIAMACEILQRLDNKARIRALCWKNSARVSVLGLARQLDSEEMIAALLEFIEYEDDFDDEHRSMLHRAVDAQEPDLVCHFCRNGARITVQDIEGDTPLHRAAIVGSYEIMEELLIAMESGHEINTTNNGGATPLHLAVIHGHSDLVDLLLSSGADPEVEDTSGKTPLDHARERSRSRQTARTIYKRLKRQKGQGVFASLITIDPDDGWQPIHYAAKKGDVSAVELIVSHDESLAAAKTDKCQWTPLHIAALYNRKAVVDVLLATPGVEREALSHNLLTPMGAAAGGFANKELLTVLKEGGCQIDGNHCWHPLTIACQRGRDAAAEALMDLGSTVNHFNSDFFSPLEWAAFQGNVRLVKALLDKGAKPDAVCTEYGLGPLHLAARRGHDEVLKVLLEDPDTDIDVTSLDGVTPLVEAAHAGHESTVRLLLKWKADKTKTWRGKTAEQVARDANHKRVANIIKIARS